MSNTNNAAATEQMISHNVYFEGKVQSLGLHTESGKATVGVMKPGTYTFSASSPERMAVVSGTLKVTQAGSNFISYKAGEEFDVAAGSSFEVTCDADAAYICYYG